MRTIRFMLILMMLVSTATPAIAQEQEGSNGGEPLMLYMGKVPSEKTQAQERIREVSESSPRENSFFDANKDLERVGLNEIRDMGSVRFEQGNYRLDSDFHLGYGDTVNVNLTGKIESTHKLRIDREGNILIPSTGKVGIMGLSLDQAREAAQRMIDQKYSNINLDLNLADVQNIRINVLGHAERPGAYSVSPFCRIAEVLAVTTGPNQEGSISDIRLIRDGKRIATFNIYDYIFKADQNKNLRLRQGDTIFIPQTKNLIAIRGNVRYPGIYEVADNSKLNDIIDTTGGVLDGKFKTKISVLRISKETSRTERFKEIIFNVPESIKPEDDIVVENHDMIIVTTELGYNPYQTDAYRTVHLSGEVMMPGDYLLNRGETIRSLLKRAGGINDLAFVEGTVFTRGSVQEKEKIVLNELVRSEERAILREEAQLAEAVLTDIEREMRQKAIEHRRKALELMASYQPQGRIIIGLEDILNGKYNISLEKDDRIFIPLAPDWIIVSGAVYAPGAVAFKEAKTLEDYIGVVGGPTTFADRNEIYVIKASGRAESKSTGYGAISRGDIIVVPEKINI